MKSIRHLSLAIITLIAPAISASAQETTTRLPAFLTDHMVVQRDAPIRIWGWDRPGTEVRVSFGSNSSRTVVDANGAWAVQLAPQSAGGPFEIVVNGTVEIKLQDVLVGDVWVCSGQSNMEWSVAQSADAEKEIAAGDHPRIRHCKINHTPAATPQNDVPSGGWKIASPQTVGDFTAVGYYFAKNIQAEIDVPIGLIGTNWGGTRIEPWTPPQGFRQIPQLKDITDKLAEFPTKNEQGQIDHQSPMALYNGMVHPLLPMAVRGVLWYQGESNVGEGMLYFEKMKALIGGWREVWKTPDLPFYFVQLAPFRYGDPKGLPDLWQAQLAALSIPETGMAVTTDIGNVEDIHPANKQEVGRRLALWALAQTYERFNQISSGPLFRSAQVEGNRVRIQFDYVDGGLASRDEQPLTGFEIAGADGNFVAADARIDGTSVIVESAQVAAPTQVRFAFNQEANPNLANQAGLPAAPFVYPSMRKTE